MARFAKVRFPGSAREYTYAMPEGVEWELGVDVVVPVRGNTMYGSITEFTDDEPDFDVKEIIGLWS